MTTKQDEMTAAFKHAADQRDSAAAARTRLELTGRDDRPAAAVGWVALVIVVVCFTVLLLGAVVGWEVLAGGWR